MFGRSALCPLTVSKRARFRAAILSASVFILSQQGTAAPITVPTSLLPGAQYRLAFVTDGTRDAISSSIADYDSFVSAEASTESSLSSISWQVIGSTTSVSAPDHTGTAPADYPGVPIFLLNGAKLVDDYSDLWDGSLDLPLSIDQHGAPLSSRVWSGTYSSGLAGFPLGATYLPGTGLSTSDDSQWIAAAPIGPPAYFPLPLYAISEVLTIPVPEPAAVALVALALVSFLIVRRRTT
jgi:hypothetical protein